LLHLPTICKANTVVTSEKTYTSDRPSDGERDRKAPKDDGT
jgi:hypothetical protein